jgi:hypothetical protein
MVGRGFIPGTNQTKLHGALAPEVGSCCFSLKSAFSASSLAAEGMFNLQRSVCQQPERFMLLSNALTAQSKPAMQPTGRNRSHPQSECAGNAGRKQHKDTRQFACTTLPYAAAASAPHQAAFVPRFAVACPRFRFSEPAESRQPDGHRGWLVFDRSKSLDFSETMLSDCLSQLATRIEFPGSLMRSMRLHRPSY